LLLGTADATTNSTPLIALSAQVGMNRSFKESHQGVDLVSMFAPVTKWSALAATPGAVPEMIRKAFKLAQTERPGAVYLAIPEDVEQAPAQGEPLPVNVPRPDEPSRGQVERAAALLGTPDGPVAAAHAKRFCPDMALRAAIECAEVSPASARRCSTTCNSVRAGKIGMPPTSAASSALSSGTTKPRRGPTVCCDFATA